MPHKLVLGFLLLLAFCQGCASLEISLHPERHIVTADSITAFNGVYEDVSLDSATGISYRPLLWDLLGGPGNSRNYTDKQVEIIVMNETTAHINLVSMGEVVKTGKFHGKLEEGCFYIRRKFMIIPLFPLITGYRNQKQRLCLLDDHLLLDASWNEQALALIWLIRSRGQGSFRFPKKENVGTQ